MLVWPAAIAFVLIRFGPALRDFFSSLGEFSLKGAGFEATAKRQQAQAAAALAAASVVRSDAATGQALANNARIAANAVSESATPKVIRRISGSRILWVDDEPKNNVYSRTALEALGISFVLSTSTDDALAQLNSGSFDAIISDMGRPPDPRAGYTLLKKIRTTGNQTPFVIFARDGDVPKHREEARRRGATDSTSGVVQLFELVISILGGGARQS